MVSEVRTGLERERGEETEEGEGEGVSMYFAVVHRVSRPVIIREFRTLAELERWLRKMERLVVPVSWFGW